MGEMLEQFNSEETFELFEGALRRVVKTYNKMIDTLQSPSDKELKMWALRALSTMGLDSHITRMTTQNRALAEFLDEENDRLAEIVMAISRIEREAGLTAEADVATLIFAAHIEFGMRVSMGRLL